MDTVFTRVCRGSGKNNNNYKKKTPLCINYNNPTSRERGVKNPCGDQSEMARCNHVSKDKKSTTSWPNPVGKVCQTHATSALIPCSWKKKPISFVSYLFFHHGHNRGIDFLLAKFTKLDISPSVSTDNARAAAAPPCLHMTCFHPWCRGSLASHTWAAARNYSYAEVPLWQHPFVAGPTVPQEKLSSSRVLCSDPSAVGK